MERKVYLQLTSKLLSLKYALELLLEPPYGSRWSAQCFGERPPAHSAVVRGKQILSPGPAGFTGSHDMLCGWQTTGESRCDFGLPPWAIVVVSLLIVSNPAATDRVRR